MENKKEEYESVFEFLLNMGLKKAMALILTIYIFVFSVVMIIMYYYMKYR